MNVIRPTLSICRGSTDWEFVYDWNWLLADHLEAAEPLADIVFFLGILWCIASVAAGIGFLLRGYLQERQRGEPPGGVLGRRSLPPG